MVGTGNVNSAGALTTSNLFVIDAVDTTDPTTGTFGTNLNFEAIQEVSVLTSAVGAEYGRAQGAIVNVITKSGTNRFEGSFKYLFANDDWNAQNTTVNQITGASLERVKFDKVNPTYSFAGGGPIWKNRAFFFGTWELIQATSPQRQTAGPVPEDFQQVREDKFSNIRGTVPVRDGHTAVGQVLPVADRRHRAQRLLGHRHRRSRGAHGAEPDRGELGGPVERRAAQQLVDGSGGGDLQVAASTSAPSKRASSAARRSTTSRTASTTTARRSTASSSGRASSSTSPATGS